jgi:RNA-directed DNA polymerase
MDRGRQKSRTACTPSPKGKAWRDGVQESELFTASEASESQEGSSRLMEEVCEPANLLKALSQVKRNGGSPGVDGMTVKELPAYVQKHWERIRNELLEGTYKPQPVRRVEIPKPNGGKRELGIPTVVDRLIQQAILRVLQRCWDPTFSESSYGFRPNRSAHQAVRRAREHIQEGYGYVVDIDIEKYFNTVNHDKLMSLIGKRIRDKRVMRLIGRYLRSGAVMGEGVIVKQEAGTPQGGPLSPLLSNVYLDELDKELERRGHRYVRYADDCNIYVRSERSAQRVKETISCYLSKRLKLKVNEQKSAAGEAKGRKFLGFSFMNGKDGIKIRIAGESLKRFRREVRRLTYRTQGWDIARMVDRLSRYLRGWLGYYGYCETPSVLERQEGWIRRRLRSVHWKHWRKSKRRYTELHRRGVNRMESASMAMSSLGPWRISHTRAMQIALPTSYFQRMGLPSLVTRTL